MRHRFSYVVAVLRPLDSVCGIGDARSLVGDPPHELALNGQRGIPRNRSLALMSAVPLAPSI